MRNISLLKKLLLYIRPKVHYRSEDGHIAIGDCIEDNRPVRLLLYDGIRESGIYLDKNGDSDPLFFYMQTLKEILLTYDGLDNALMIGGGGFAFPRYYKSCVPNGIMTVIEKEGFYYDLARKYFFIDEFDGVNVLIRDGLSFIAETAIANASAEKESDRTEYDLIIFDAYDGNKVSQGLLSPNTFKMVRQILSKRGIVAFNMINEAENVFSMQAYMAQAQLNEIFGYTMLINCKVGWNSILLASDREL